MKLCTKFELNQTIRRGVIAISVFDLMTLNIALRVALGSGMIFTKVWSLTTYPCLNYCVLDADTLCHAVTLTFDLFTLKVRGTSSVTWSKSVRNLNEIEQSPAELLIILGIFTHGMSRCYPNLLTLNFYNTSGVMRLNSVQNLSEIE